jgi:hypothetical protein
MSNPSPTFENLAYGSHPRQCLDLWVASPRPSPVVISVYGGGWMRGDKLNGRSNDCLPTFLADGISVAIINYRHTGDTPFPGSFHDTARAVQFLRSRHDDLGIDPSRIGAYGTSAGAVNVLWTAFSPDRADPLSPDPIERQSSRLQCVFAHNVPTFLDQESLRAKIPGRAYEHPALAPALGPLGFDNPRAEEIFRAASPLYLANASAPPIALSYREFSTEYTGPKPGDGIHHPAFGPPMIRRLEELGVECSCIYHDDFPELEQKEFGDMVVGRRHEFFARHLLAL